MVAGWKAQSGGPHDYPKGTRDTQPRSSDLDRPLHRNRVYSRSPSPLRVSSRQRDREEASYSYHEADRRAQNGAPSRPSHRAKNQDPVHVRSQAQDWDQLSTKDYGQSHQLKPICDRQASGRSVAEEANSSDHLDRQLHQRPTRPRQTWHQHADNEPEPAYTHDRIRGSNSRTDTTYSGQRYRAKQYYNPHSQSYPAYQKNWQRGSGYSHHYRTNPKRVESPRKIRPHPAHSPMRRPYAARRDSSSERRDDAQRKRRRLEDRLDRHQSPQRTGRVHVRDPNHTRSCSPPRSYSRTPSRNSIRSPSRSYSTGPRSASGSIRSPSQPPEPSRFPRARARSPAISQASPSRSPSSCRSSSSPVRSPRRSRRRRSRTPSESVSYRSSIDGQPCAASTRPSRYSRGRSLTRSPQGDPWSGSSPRSRSPRVFRHEAVVYSPSPPRRKPSFQYSRSTSANRRYSLISPARHRNISHSPSSCERTSSTSSFNHPASTRYQQGPTELESSSPSQPSTRPGSNQNETHTDSHRPQRSNPSRLRKSSYPVEESTPPSPSSPPSRRSQLTEKKLSDIENLSSLPRSKNESVVKNDSTVIPALSSSVPHKPSRSPKRIRPAVNSVRKAPGMPPTAPVAQTSAGVRRFFPGDDEDDEIDVIPIQTSRRSLSTLHRLQSEEAVEPELPSPPTLAPPPPEQVLDSPSQDDCKSPPLHRSWDPISPRRSLTPSSPQPNSSKFDARLHNGRRATTYERRDRAFSPRRQRDFRGIHRWNDHYPPQRRHPRSYLHSHPEDQTSRYDSYERPVSSTHYEKPTPKSRTPQFRTDDDIESTVTHIEPPPPPPGPEPHILVTNLVPPASPSNNVLDSHDPGARRPPQSQDQQAKRVEQVSQFHQPPPNSVSEASQIVSNGRLQPVSQTRDIYERLVQVGEGTYGKVYKAQNVETGELVAMKRIRMEAERDGFPITAIREIKLLQGLRHENIVNLVEMVVSKGQVYIVFEYMDHDLSGVLHHPSINFQECHIKSLMHQLLRGLQYMHEGGVLHRDLKGSNILLNKRGELKIADFGLARRFERGKEPGREGRGRGRDYTNRVITLWYKPPELLLGATVYGEEVDMWSAGAIFLELFARRPIFQAADEIEQLHATFKLIGTPNEESWKEVKRLPWYELVKPKIESQTRLREEFYDDGFEIDDDDDEKEEEKEKKKKKKIIKKEGAMKLAERLLTLCPDFRPSAREALEFDYFKIEEPLMELPTELLSKVKGEWHELESKRARKRRDL